MAETVPIDRETFADPNRLRRSVEGADAVLHLAGVNRPPDDRLLDDNVRLAERLTKALDAVGGRPVVVYANSTQTGSATRFGNTKQAAADHLAAWGKRTGAKVADVRLPNLFGEHGRPHYNSVVATFCYELARGGEPKILEDRTLSLLHAQDAADFMLDLIASPQSGSFAPEGRPMNVSQILEKLQGFHDLYATADLPNLADPVDRSLFNTYRSFCFPAQFPIYPKIRSDDRGILFESVRSWGGRSQVFSSATRPSVTRGNHFHLHKVERFLVLSGSAVIALRRLFAESVVQFEVSGEKPAIVDIPTMWTHSITNTGADDLLTLFWADEILNPERPDTFAEPVQLAGHLA
jgi:UDP-2-acetamido-2,6-beta-L-arabino-hexul-4-ose reductase